MTFPEAVLTFFRKALVFSGRASLSEFWWAAFFVVATSSMLAFADSRVFGPRGENENFSDAPLSNLFWLAMLIPGLAIGVRRLHDTGRRGWLIVLPYFVLYAGSAFVLGGALGLEFLRRGDLEYGPMGWPASLFAGTALAVVIVALIATFILLISWLAQSSDPETNAYGPPPVS